MIHFEQFTSNTKNKLYIVPIIIILYQSAVELFIQITIL